MTLPDGPEFSSVGPEMSSVGPKKTSQPAEMASVGRAGQPLGRSGDPGRLDAELELGAPRVKAHNPNTGSASAGISRRGPMPQVSGARSLPDSLAPGCEYLAPGVKNLEPNVAYPEPNARYLDPNA